MKVYQLVDNIYENKLFILFQLGECFNVTLDEGESVYYEPGCSLIPSIDNGVGCNVGNIQNCRYCDFDTFKPCPTTKTLTSTVIKTFDFDNNINDILLDLNENETEVFGGELKIDYSYNDKEFDYGYNVTDLSSISKISWIK